MNTSTAQKSLKGLRLENVCLNMLRTYQRLVMPIQVANLGTLPHASLEFTALAITCFKCYNHHNTE